jgi:hypothetical protein
MSLSEAFLSTLEIRTSQQKNSPKNFVVVLLALFLSLFRKLLNLILEIKSRVQSIGLSKVDFGRYEARN